MRDAVEKGWSEAFGSVISRAPGIRVIRDAPNLEHRILLLRLGDGLTIVAPSGIDVPTDLTPDEAFTPEFASSLAPGRVLGPSIHAYADRACFVRQEPCDARRVDDAGGFDALVPAPEWNEGGFHEDPGDEFWYACFDGGERVAMGNMTNFNGTNGDVGLVTRPDRRGRGYARKLAGAMIEDAFARGLDVVRYRALESNVPSRAVCRTLGFVDDGANIAVRLDES
jgi:GNAT superfamily N-acetyltransferase